jgi:hypothetical protein
MSTTKTLRQLVDWRAAIRAGIISGLVFFLVNMLLTWLVLDAPWITARFFASLVLGKSILPPPATFDGVALAVGLLVNQGIAIPFACLIAYVFHRWGLLVGIAGGALFGLVLYGISFYSLTNVFPQFYFINSSLMLISHVIFGAVAGGVYELLEVETFVEA